METEIEEGEERRVFFSLEYCVYIVANLIQNLYSGTGNCYYVPDATSLAIKDGRIFKLQLGLS